MKIQKFTLSYKLSSLVILIVLVFVGVLGLYFDAFIKEHYLENTRKRMQHGFSRLASDLKSTAEELQKGIAFVQTEEGFLASIELINNYQDKAEYNAILLDEEKKIIAGELLKRVKHSLNHEIALYDRSEELVAFVVKAPRGYQLNFVSYENGLPVLYRTYEDEEWVKLDGMETLPEYYRHQNYYTASVAAKGTVTYHLHDGNVVSKSHLSIFEGESDRVLAHIEMSRLFDEAYFTKLSGDLDMKIVGSTVSSSSQAFALKEMTKDDELEIFQTESHYASVASMPTRDGTFYYHVELNKSFLAQALSENRQQLLLILLLVVGVLLMLLHVVLNRTLGIPLGRLMEQIRKIEQRDYSLSQVVQTGDELEAISRNVNQLATTIQERESALQQTQESLEHLSYHDPLTGLPNRRFFMAQLEHAIVQAKRNRSRAAVLFFDLDEFKHVNDMLGHDVGDQLLNEVAKRLRATLRESDLLARIGGDEFNALIEGVDTVRDIEVVVAKLIADFKVPFVCCGHEIRTSSSIGVAFYPDDGEDAVTLIKHADLAMYQSKEAGRNSYSFFSRELADYIRERTTYINALKSSLDAKCSEFLMLYQPKFSMQTGEISGIEALIRWQSPLLGYVRPEKFIRMAEETNVIIPLGEWIMEQAFRDFVMLKRTGCTIDKISINVSSIQLMNSDMVKTLRQVIGRTGIRPEQVELEITESYIATDEQKALRTLHAFREMGVDLAIDDFGTGYSSMSYLQQLPVTRLKIDKSFVDRLPESQESIAIARAIIALAKAFELSITAEGVETKDQLDFLKTAEVDEVQGHFYAKPLGIEELKMLHCPRRVPA